MASMRGGSLPLPLFFFWCQDCSFSTGLGFVTSAFFSRSALRVARRCLRSERNQELVKRSTLLPLVSRPVLGRPSAEKRR